MTRPSDSTLTRRERRKLELRARIVEAANELFDRHGFDATTVAEICAKADVANKTFFNHFPSKRDLLAELAAVHLDQLLTKVEDARKLPTGTGERLRSFFQCVADDAEAAGPLRREMVAEIIHVAHEVHTETEQVRKIHAAFAGFVEGGLELGDVTNAHSPETLTEMIMGAFYVLMFNWANVADYPLRQQCLASAAFLADAITLPAGREGAGADEPDGSADDGA